MPFDIRKSTAGGVTGYRVSKVEADGKRVYFSKHALSLEEAKKQRVAMILSEMGKNKKIQKAPIPMFEGGYVPNVNKLTPVQGKKDDWGDGSIVAVLEYGELVVPREYVPAVAKFMKENGMHVKGL